MKNKVLKVTGVRYFETNRGLGYEAKTETGKIWNDGMGGCTYYEPNGKGRDHSYTEQELERFIDRYEYEKYDVAVETVYSK